MRKGIKIFGLGIIAIIILYLIWIKLPFTINRHSDIKLGNKIIEQIETFKKSVPRLGAKVERNLSTGWGFRKATDGDKVNWVKPGGGGP